MTAETIEQTYDVQVPARIKLSNLRGSTRVRAGEEGVIRVTAVKDTYSGDAEHTRIELAQEADGRVVVEVRFDQARSLFGFGSQPCRVDLVVTVPRLTGLKAAGVSSDILVEGLDGDCEIDSVSGDLSLKDLHGGLAVRTVSGDVNAGGLEGKLRIQTVSGDVHGEGLRGSLEMQTVSGDVTLQDCQLTSVTGHSTSGDIAIQTPLGEGPYHFNSISGDLRLLIEAGAHLTAVLHSLSGSIHSGLPMTSSAHRNGSQVIEVGGGGVTVAMNSMSGDLQLSALA